MVLELFCLNNFQQIPFVSFLKPTLQHFYQMIKHKNLYTDFDVIKEKLVILSVSIMPIVWYFLTQNHSEEHYMFTCKNVAILIFAVISAIAYRTEE